VAFLLPHSLLAIPRKKIGKPWKDIVNLNGFEYMYLNGLKIPYFSTYPPLSTKVISMGTTRLLAGPQWRQAESGFVGG
jgi:hypothetical protein